MKTRVSESTFEKDKLEIIKWVTSLQDETSVERLKQLKDASMESDWWVLISEEEKNAIDKGLDDIKAGRLQAHEEVKKLYKKWL